MEYTVSKYWLGGNGCVLQVYNWTFYIMWILVLYFTWKFLSPWLNKNFLFKALFEIDFWTSRNSFSISFRHLLRDVEGKAETDDGKKVVHNVHAGSMVTFICLACSGAGAVVFTQAPRSNIYSTLGATTDDAIFELNSSAVDLLCWAGLHKLSSQSVRGCAVRLTVVCVTDVTVQTEASDNKERNEKYFQTHGAFFFFF